MMIFTRLIFLLLPLITLSAWSAEFRKANLKTQLDARLSQRSAREKGAQVTPEQIKVAEDWWRSQLDSQSPSADYEIHFLDLGHSGRDAGAVFELKAKYKNGETKSLIGKLYKNRCKCAQETTAFKNINANLNFEALERKYRNVHQYPLVTKMLHAFLEKQPLSLPFDQFEQFEASHPPIILFEMARGVTLYELLEDFCYRPDAAKDQETLASLKIAGRQIGNLHAKFGKLNSDGEVLSLLHGDMHLRNLVWDKAGKRICFIDNATMNQYLDMPGHCYEDLALLFFWQEESLRKYLSEQYRKCTSCGSKVTILLTDGAITSIPLNCRSIIYYFYAALLFNERFNCNELMPLKERLNRVDKFTLALKEGYLSAFADSCALPYLKRTINVFLEP